MEKSIRKKYLESAIELKKHLGTETYRSMKPERAFIEWYITARFGKIGQDAYDVIDGQKDGGVDAIVRTTEEIFVLQMKYEVQPRISTVTRSEIAGFEKVARFFKDPKSNNDFDSWIDSVRDDLKRKFREIYNLIKKDSRSVRFIFVTTKSFELQEGDLVEIEDVQDILSLWNLYYEGFTPPTEEIKLQLSGVWHKKSENDVFETYVGLADVLDFMKLMDQDRNERLFAQNVRTDLASTINKAIRNTYENNPEKFWLGNNGVYIVCKRISSSGENYTLTYPSVINGSQTLHAIYKSKKRHSCKILLRILCMDVIGNPKLLGEVIRRTNSQNAMNPINLCAHDPYQFNIAQYLDQFNIFYERREKEWKNEKRDVLSDYIHITMKETGQWLSTLHPEIGFGTARSSVREVFENQTYEDVFGSFDGKLKNEQYKDLLYIVWSGLFVKMLMRFMPKVKKSNAKMCQLLLVKSIYDSIRTSNIHITEMLRNHWFGKKNIPNNICNEISNIIGEFQKIQKKKQQIDDNIDFSNYFKRNDLTAYAYEKTITNIRRKKILQLIEKGSDKIR